MILNGMQCKLLMQCASKYAWGLHFDDGTFAGDCQHPLAVRDGASTPNPTEPLVYKSGVGGFDISAGAATSHELEKLFPSSALEFSRLDLSRLSAVVNLASFWGDSIDWTYVRAPEDVRQ